MRFITHWRKGWLPVGLVLGALLCAWPSAAIADQDVFTVNTTIDPGDGNCDTNGCTLREAMEAAKDGDTDVDQINLSMPRNVFFPTITLGSNLPVITEPLAIATTGPRTVIINGNKAFRPFAIVGGAAKVTLTRLVITDGRATKGAAAIVDTGTLTIRNSLITGNSATESGGGLSNTGGRSTLVIEDSTITENTAVDGGGGVAMGFGPLIVRRSTISTNHTTGNGGHGGGVAVGASSTALIESSTITRNSTDGEAAHGGGLYIASPSVAVSDSTIAANGALDSSSTGGGIYSAGSATQPSLTNTIVADNVRALTTAGGRSSDLASTESGDAFFLAFSLVETSAGAPFSESVPGSNILGQDPQLGALANNGGPTQTLLPAPTSPVVDRGSTDAASDQRGLGRPLDLGHVANSTAPGGDGADIGAVELTDAEGPPAPPPAPPSPEGPAGTVSPAPSEVRSASDQTSVRARAAIRSLRLAPPRFSVKRGTTVSFGLNLPASVTFRIARKLAGRRVGRSCVAPRRANRGRRPCTRLVFLRGSFTRAAKAGTSRFRFAGRLGGRKLGPGNYELRATPRAGATSRAAFRIVI